jgi:hypothetical protein
MTPTQRRLARHALGLPNSRRCSYRNRFIAAYAPGAYDEWCRMEDAGLAERSRNIRDSATVRFWLTESGARAALNPGETLCPEDFPNHGRD